MGHDDAVDGRNVYLGDAHELIACLDLLIDQGLCRRNKHHLALQDMQRIDTDHCIQCIHVMRHCVLTVLLPWQASQEAD